MLTRVFFTDIMGDRNVKTVSFKEEQQWNFLLTQQM